MKVLVIIAVVALVSCCGLIGYGLMENEPGMFIFAAAIGILGVLPALINYLINTFSKVSPRTQLGFIALFGCLAVLGIKVFYGAQETPKTIKTITVGNKPATAPIPTQQIQNTTTNSTVIEELNPGIFSPQPITDPNPEEYSKLLDAAEMGDVPLVIECMEKLKTLGRNDLLADFDETGFPKQVNDLVEEEKKFRYVEGNYLNRIVNQFKESENSLIALGSVAVNPPLSGVHPSVLLPHKTKLKDVWSQNEFLKHPTERLTTATMYLGNMQKAMIQFSDAPTYENLNNLVEFRNHAVGFFRALCPSVFKDIKQISSVNFEPPQIPVPFIQFDSERERITNKIVDQMSVLESLDRMARVDQATDYNFVPPRQSIIQMQKQIEVVYNTIGQFLRMTCPDDEATDLAHQISKKRYIPMRTALGEYYRALNSNDEMVLNKAQIRFNQVLANAK